MCCLRFQATEKLVAAFKGPLACKNYCELQFKSITIRTIRKTFITTMDLQESAVIIISDISDEVPILPRLKSSTTIVCVIMRSIISLIGVLSLIVLEIHSLSSRREYIWKSYRTINKRFEYENIFIFFLIRSWRNVPYLFLLHYCSLTCIFDGMNDFYGAVLGIEVHAVYGYSRKRWQQTMKRRDIRFYRNR